MDKLLYRLGRRCVRRRRTVVALWLVALVGITIAGKAAGGHYRDDFPHKAPAFGNVNFVVRKGSDGEMTVGSRPIPEMPAELKQIIEEMK